MGVDSKYEILQRMILAFNKIDGVYYLFSRQLGVNENDLSFLYALNDGRLHSQREISDNWLIPRTTINTIVKHMVEAGYVVLEAEEHRKEKRILLTEKGREYADRLLGKLYQAEEAAITRTLERFSPEFVEAMEVFGKELHRELTGAERKKG